MSGTKILQLSLAIAGLGIALGGQRDEAAPPPRSSPPTRGTMRDHFKAVVLVRDALIAGNLELAKWNARWIAEREPDPAVQSWSLYVDHMRERAAVIVAAKTREDVAHATAELGLECGHCHAANHASPTFPQVDPRVPESGPRAHMLRHQWAAEQMWIGLVTPSETSWNAGVAELAETPLAQENILPNASVTPALTQLAVEVHELGAEGARATTWDERATVYGRLLTTCARCHSVLPRGG